MESPTREELLDHLQRVLAWGEAAGRAGLEGDREFVEHCVANHRVLAASRELLARAGRQP